MKKILTILLTLCLLIGLTPLNVRAENPTSGSCGENLTWVLNSDNVLTISGEGEMDDYVSPSHAPWYLSRDRIVEIVIEHGVTSIGFAAFKYCENVTKVAIPDSVTSIGDVSFQSCESLPRVDIGSNVTEIGEFAFDNCYSLTGIYVAEDNPCYMSDASGVLFNKDQTSLIKAPEKLSGDYYIPSGVVNVESYAFSYCAGLTGIDIPDTVTHMGINVFSYCTGLTSVEFPDSVVELGYHTFHGCSGLTSVKYPSNVTNIGNYEFFRCENLTCMEIPEGILEIRGCAFLACYRLTKIEIPASVTLIESAAFSDCTSLSQIIFRGDAPTFESSVFDEVVATVYYPAGNETWTDSVMRNYGGNITWVTYTPGQPLPVHNPFTDVKTTAYYYQPVLWAVENNITGGTSATTFSPNASCTRGQIVTFLWAAAGRPEPTSSTNPFTDVKSSAYYYKAVLWAVENGITGGTSATTFSPNNPCTRGQVVTFLWAAKGRPEPESTSNAFSDVKASDYYCKAVLWAVENGITSGIGNGKFGPGNTCTRGQIVTFLYKAFN